jgi:Trk K+ transport system NAD-binding subunit
LGEKEGLQIVIADARDPSTLPPATDGVDAVAAVTGTTAFPSKRCKILPNMGTPSGKGTFTAADFAACEHKGTD